MIPVSLHFTLYILITVPYHLLFCLPDPFPFSFFFLPPKIAFSLHPPQSPSLIIHHTLFTLGNFNHLTYLHIFSFLLSLFSSYVYSSCAHTSFLSLFLDEETVYSLLQQDSFLCLITIYLYPLNTHFIRTW